MSSRTALNICLIVLLVLFTFLPTLAGGCGPRTDSVEQPQE